jgi:hypothetical protein
MAVRSWATIWRCGGTPICRWERCGATYPLVDYLQAFPNYVADQRGAASVAHLYGRNRVGAESFTDMIRPGARVGPFGARDINEQATVMDREHD